MKVRALIKLLKSQDQEKEVSIVLDKRSGYYDENKPLTIKEFVITETVAHKTYSGIPLVHPQIRKENPLKLVLQQ